VFLFLKLGTLSFGGPAGHVALMEHEVVHKRKWLSREYFMDLVAATNLVPGPNATEMAIHIGYLRAGWLGLVVSGIAFIVPAFLLTLALAWGYTQYGELPQVGAILYGIKPAVVAIIIVAIGRLGRQAIVSTTAAVFFGLTLLAAVLQVDDLLLMLSAGVLMIVWRERRRLPWLACLALGWPAPALSLSLDWSSSGRLGQLFLYFLKVGSVLYGSGLVLYAFIQRDVVAGFGWLTQQQLIDAIAAGQITPGPVLSSATFIGYLIGGTSGAGLATLGVFLPSFVIVALTGPLIPRLRNWQIGKAFLQGATLAALALILKTGILLGRSALVDVWCILIALASVVLLWRLRVDAIWVVIGGALVGLLKLILSV
jgi:chromate transporter